MQDDRLLIILLNQHLYPIYIIEPVMPPVPDIIADSFPVATLHGLQYIKPLIMIILYQITHITAFLAIAMCQNDCFMRFCIIWKEFRFQFKIIIRCLFKGFKLLMIKPALCLCQYFLIFFTRNHLFLDFRVFLST